MSSEILVPVSIRGTSVNVFGEASDINQPCATPDFESLVGIGDGGRLDLDMSDPVVMGGGDLAQSLSICVAARVADTDGFGMGFEPQGLNHYPLQHNVLVTTTWELFTYTWMPPIGAAGWALADIQNLWVRITNIDSPLELNIASVNVEVFWGSTWSYFELAHDLHRPPPRGRRVVYAF